MADEVLQPAPASASVAKSQFAGDSARSLRAAARNEARLAALLATIAGFVDAYGIIAYGVFVSFMSGNTTQTGYQAAEGEFGPASASASALAILFFFVGTFAGAFFVGPRGRRARRLVFTFVAATLAAIIGLTQLGLLSTGFGIAIVSFAMGVFNSAPARVGAQAMSPTFVTGTLSRVASHLALATTRAPLTDSQGPWDTHLRRALMLARVWAGFLAGAIFAGAATPRFGAWVPSAPVLILAALAAFDRRNGAAR
jgi:uncharacterized membrane protein YoaK (UPF0700 family)